MSKSKKEVIPKPHFPPLRRVYVMKDGKIRNGRILCVGWRIKEKHWTYELDKRLGWFNESRLYPNRAALAARILSR